MEITAAIEGLASLTQSCHVTLFSDSQYLVKAMTEGWVTKWQANRWMRNNKEKALNPDLWKRLLVLCEKHEVDFRWVRGHNNHIENELCDRMANEAAKRSGLPADAGYEAAPARLF
jgi:ribonuclease HI